MRLQRIYPITSRDNIHGLSQLELVQRLAAGGARLIQYREKESSDHLMFEQLLEIRKFCRNAEIQLIVNDRVDLALAVDAEGVHLGQDDLPVETARRLLGARAIIGVSTHDLQQYETATRTTADYIAVGPIFKSPTKKGRQALGCEFLRKVSTGASKPIVAIGGINLENVTEVWNSGAFSVAVISDIVNSPDPAERVRRYLQKAEDTLP